MKIEPDKLLLVGSLMDQLLEELTPLNTFMRANEYEKVKENCHSWNSKEFFLEEKVYTPLDFTKEQDQLDFELTLNDKEKSKILTDALAMIPYEFQYIMGKKGTSDIIVLRMFLDATHYRIATIDVTQDVVNTIQDHFSQLILKIDNKEVAFDTACFLTVKEYAERMFRMKSNLYDDWNTFKKEFENQYQITIKDYSNIGKYLWQINYLYFDNRYQKKERALTLVEQIEKYYSTHQEKEEEVIEKKSIISSLKSLLKDEK